jgi:hypothetical protein
MLDVARNTSRNMGRLGIALWGGPLMLDVARNMTRNIDCWTSI